MPLTPLLSFLSSPYFRPLLSFFISLFLSLHSLRKKSLSPSGSLSAFFVGFLSLSFSLRFGITLYTFYVTSTLATKHNSLQKSRLEHNHSAFGNRSATQVLASSLPAVLVAALYFSLFRSDAAVTNSFQGALLLAFLLFFAACAGDTFASELGIVGAEPVLIIAPWRKVPRGTNGGVTMLGSIASGLGGLIVGGVFFATGPLLSLDQALLVVVGVLGGVVGSSIDSMLGAVAQISVLEKESGKVGGEVGEKGRYVVVCGRDFLSGEGVNALSAVLTMALAPALVTFFPGEGMA